MDERHALGMIMQNAQVANNLGGFEDQRVGAAFANEHFASAAAQGTANTQAARQFTDENIFTRVDTVENLSEDRMISTMNMLAEANDQPNGAAAAIMQVSEFMDKKRRIHDS